MKKKSFLLLEILIGLAILELALLPLMKRPIAAYRQELLGLEEVERERLSDWTFSEIKEKLIQNKIRWNQLPQKAGKTAPFSLDPITLEIPNLLKKTLKRSYTLECRSEKKGLNGEIYRLLKIEISFKPPLKKEKKRVYRTIVRLMPLDLYQDRA